MIAEDHLIGFDHPLFDAVTLAVALGARHFLAAAGRAVQGDGSDPDTAGAAQIHAVAGFQSTGEGDRQFAVASQGLDK